MTDVINFAKIKQKREQEKLDQLTTEHENDEDEAADISTLAAMEIVYTLLEMGYPIQDNAKCIKDILAIIESVRALAYRAKGLETPFHQVNDTLYDFIDNEPQLLEYFIEDMMETIEE